MLVILCSFAAYRCNRGDKKALCLLGVGTLFCTVALVDLILQAAVSPERFFAAQEKEFSFRSPVDLQSIDDDAIVIVGDSCVWGAGVEEEEAFARVLQTVLESRGVSTTVHNLGLVGTGLSSYMEVLERVRKKRVVVVCLYINDMPQRQTFSRKIHEALIGIGRSSVLVRVIADILEQTMFGFDVENYHNSLVRNFDKSDASYAARWRLFTSLLDHTIKEANDESQFPPILVILPLVTDYSQYPLVEAHHDIVQFGEGLDCTVIDMLPVFSRRFPRGDQYRAKPNDGHFNAEVHRAVAEVLADALAGDLTRETDSDQKNGEPTSR